MDHSGDNARPSILAPPPALHRPRRIIMGTTRDPQDQSIRPEVLVKLATVTQLPCPQQIIPGTTKRHLTQDITTAIIPSNAPTSPPAPSYTAAPTGESSAKKKETTRQRCTAHSVRTSSQVGTQTTRPLVAEKPGLTTKRGRAKRSDSHKIPHTKGSLTVGAAQGQQGDRWADTTSAPTSQKETKDPTQSAHYRLWGPGFLDVSLVPEEQELATPIQAPAQAMANAGMNLDSLESIQADDLRKLTESLQGLVAARQEGKTPTLQPPIHT